MPNFENVPPCTQEGGGDAAQTSQRPSDRRERVAPRRVRRPRAIWVTAIAAILCVGLSACGGSSKSSSNAAATSAPANGSANTTSTGGSSTGGSSTSGSSSQGAAPAGGRGRFAAVRECLQKNGVTLPTRTPGSRPPAGGAFLGGGGGGAALPKGMTRTQFQAALAKCGGNFGARFGGAGGPGARRVNSPVFRAALTKYAACLRENGIDIPAPNTSGKGPIFSTKGIDTSSAKFRTATMKCRASLVGAFRRPGTTTSPSK